MQCSRLPWMGMNQAVGLYSATQHQRYERIIYKRRGQYPAAIMIGTQNFNFLSCQDIAVLRSSYVRITAKNRKKIGLKIVDIEGQAQKPLFLTLYLLFCSTINYKNVDKRLKYCEVLQTALEEYEPTSLHIQYQCTL
jgi:hypothetical protein